MKSADRLYLPGLNGIRAVAALSYKFYKMPFLRMKDKFSVVKSTNEGVKSVI